jgi:hypothetical protein
MTLLFPAAVRGARLEPTTSQAWEDYVNPASLRMQPRLSPGQCFLWVDDARCKDLYQPSVIDSTAIATAGEKDRFSMLLLNKSLLLKTALDADYESLYFKVDDRRAYSLERTTRVQEIEEYGSPAQRVLLEGG